MKALAGRDRHASPTQSNFTGFLELEKPRPLLLTIGREKRSMSLDFSGQTRSIPDEIC